MNKKNNSEKTRLEINQGTANDTDGLNQVLEFINAKGNTRKLNDAVKDEK
ncbi:hypothetical protein [Fictibacillus sp. KU28468]|nr:hypothetical protein [Fictibacillus sp. KU28468]UZJ77618.1 hypothetical protein OKX00_15745 [Fictibacillus sp. KU28468]